MKKLLLFILLCIGFYSCTPTEVVRKNTELPIEIVSLKELNKYDTLLVIQSNDKIFMFDDKEEYQGAIDKLDYEKNSMLVFFMLGLMLAIGIIIIITNLD